MRTSGDALLEIEGLVKGYGGRLALAGIDLTVRAGDMVALVGPNGAGKTTLVSIVAGLRRRDAGSVLLGGVDPGRRPATTNRLVGLATQDIAVYPSLSVRENLRYMARLAGMGRRDLDDAVDDVLARLELTSVASHRVRELSGGVRRRVHVGMAMVHRPKLLILDEPTANADLLARRAMLGAIQELGTHEVAVLWSTHHLSEVEELGGRVVVLDQGEILVDGRIDDIVSAHGWSGLVVAIERHRHLDLPDLPEGTVWAGDQLRVPGADPSALAASLLPSLCEVATVTSIELVRPSLESVYLGLTGRHFIADADGASSEADGADPCV